MALVAACVAVALAVAAPALASSMSSRHWVRSLLQAPGTCTCLVQPDLSCPAVANCPSGSTFTVSPESAGCTVGSALTSSAGEPGPEGCQVTTPGGGGLPAITHDCGGHDVVRSATFCAYGITINGGDPEACKDCASVTYVSNCDVATAGASPLTPGNIGAGRNNIQCPNNFQFTCTTAGQVIDLNALGCTATNQIVPYPGPLFFYDGTTIDCNYYYANETNTLPTTITCTQEMVDGLGCSYRISGMPSNGCLNKGLNTTRVFVGGVGTTSYVDHEVEPLCAQTVVPPSPPLGWVCIGP